MFTFVLKETKAGIEIVITRILLAVAAIGTLFYTNEINYGIKITVAVILLGTSYFVKTIAAKFKISHIVLLIIAAVVLFIGMGSFVFSGFLLCYALLLKFLQKTPQVIIDNNSVMVKKVFVNEVFEWADFTNIILKDGLLTLDFTDNKLLQLNVDEEKTVVNETIFNSFCKKSLNH